MEEKRPIYVLDTNVLVDYPDIIPGEKVGKPKNPTIDLAGSHLVIPSAVVRELSSFKREKSDRGRVARRVLKRLRKLTRKNKSGHWWRAYRMGEPIRLDGTGMTLSILPIHKSFKKSLPYSPSEEDMDGQIILAAISASYVASGMPNDGSCILKESIFGKIAKRMGEIIHFTENKFDENQYVGRNVIILTNDNGLAIRAHERGIATDRFGYDCPAPYVGRRDLKVPNELFKKMFLEQRVSRADFERLMPDEAPLIANEFIIMVPEEPAGCPFYNPKRKKDFGNIGRYDCDEDALVPLKFVKSFPVKPLTVGQALYAEALADPRISAVICTGPAGSGKTYMVTIYSYIATMSGVYMGISVVPCENTSKLGALPGGLNSKMDPQVQPFKNALRNYLYKKGFGQPKKIQLLEESETDYSELDEDSVDSMTEKTEFTQVAETETSVFEEAQSDYQSETEANTEEGTKDGNEEAEQGTNTNGRGRSGRKRKTRHRTKESHSRHQKSLKVLLDDKVEDIWRDFFSNIPIEVARGQDFNDQIAIYDEFQDQNVSQADTLIKRISGERGKIVITGDIEQIHSPYLDENNNGIVYATETLYDSPLVARVSFTEEDVVRHPLVKMVAERQKQAKSEKEEP